MLLLSKARMTVRWGACISDSFKSPQLFNIYNDGLSDILNKSSIGGSIGGKGINYIMLYADDLCVVSLWWNCILYVHVK